MLKKKSLELACVKSNTLSRPCEESESDYLLLIINCLVVVGKLAPRPIP
jgi:hypothetical protein